MFNPPWRGPADTDTSSLLGRSSSSWAPVAKGKTAICSSGSASHTLQRLSSSSEEDEDAEDVRHELGQEVVEIEGEEWIVKNIQAEAGAAEGDENTICVERWKANADDSKKGMFDCFEQSGIFAAVCNHGLTIIACDMVRSGEL